MHLSASFLHKLSDSKSVDVSLIDLYMQCVKLAVAKSPRRYKVATRRLIPPCPSP